MATTKKNRIKVIRETIVDLVEQVRNEGISPFISRAKEIEFGNFNRAQLIREARKNLNELAETIQSSDLYLRAKATARQTKDQVLSVLSIPSQDEMVKLSKKITSLEQKMNKLSRKAA